MTLPPNLLPETRRPKSEASKAVDALLQLHPKGFDLSLGRIAGLLNRLGDPHLKLPPVIHIAGTNGKGSASAFCRATLEAGDYRVHVHTSPHLVDWHERYRLAGTLVDDATLTEAIDRVANANGGQAITVFELMSAVMFVLFSERPADVCVVEVGLGGRADATNVIAAPSASLIMPVGLDHQAYLGETVEQIAGEKGGIIKSGSPLVIGSQPHDAAAEKLEAMAKALGVATYSYGQDFLAYEEHGRMVFQHDNGLMDLPLPALAGRHQLANASAAFMAVKAAGFRFDDQIAETALRTVSWPGRMQRLVEGPLVGLAPEQSEIWLDGGHNPDAGKAVAEFLAGREEGFERPLFLVIGMINTKDVRGYFDAFAGMARHVFTVPVDESDASVEPGLLAAHAEAAGLSAEPVASVAAALSLLGDGWNGLEAAPRILIGGSLYLAGSVLAQNGPVPQ